MILIYLLLIVVGLLETGRLVASLIWREPAVQKPPPKWMGRVPPLLLLSTSAVYTVGGAVMMGLAGFGRFGSDYLSLGTWHIASINVVFFVIGLLVLSNGCGILAAAFALHPEWQEAQARRDEAYEMQRAQEEPIRQAEREAAMRQFEADRAAGRVHVSIWRYPYDESKDLQLPNNGSFIASALGCIGFVLLLNGFALRITRTSQIGEVLYWCSLPLLLASSTIYHLSQWPARGRNLLMIACTAALLGTALP